ncbi:pyridoxal phosphate-dependent aminotransferase [Chondromyces apiculatus]|uniref:Aspartate aminotransferase n=1 Tax=Chondromyces apiculatus DSM 436 TaxID=1192034 RepID=A0A017T9S3_9BACT|nr:aminotransferase class I/II-fold pyridoxal phosphate-dependent enzyme [Chondromyces apiculatus]EYF05535.1 Aspartate aminotransferase [Chondromyces apiculatus DSM 436]
MSTSPVTPPLGDAEVVDAGLSALARGVIGSEILKIAAEIRAMKARGADVCNLTVGDFDPAQFQVPRELVEGTRAALDDGQTNYPPSDGVLPLREALVRYYERELGLRYPVDAVLVASGARPLLYATYRTLIDPGDAAVYPVPSWNNNHYAYLSGARPVPLPVNAGTNFFPTADLLRPLIGEARTVLLNSPLNPTGTVMDPAEMRRIAELVVEENTRRARDGERPVYLIFDQVYWALTFGEATHATPVSLVPEVAPYTILLDAISKSFCATGLRVGWGFMPPAVRRRMADILGHIGAWAPKAEQIATATLLDRPEAIRAFQEPMKQRVRERLDALFNGFKAMKSEGLPVDAIAPQGAIYLSVRFDLVGATVRGRALQSNEDIRRVLLEGAGLAAVPFQAFGLKEDTGWFRLSVGAVSTATIEGVMPRLRELLVGAKR